MRVFPRSLWGGTDELFSTSESQLLLPFLHLHKTYDFSARLHPQFKPNEIMPDSSPTRIIIVGSQILSCTWLALTFILKISLAYAPPPDGTGAVSGLHGPINDFLLMLRRYDCKYGSLFRTNLSSFSLCSRPAWRYVWKIYTSE